MRRNWRRQAVNSTVTVTGTGAEIILSGSIVIPNSPTGTIFEVNSTAASSTTPVPAITDVQSLTPDQSGSRDQPIPLRALIAVCVAAFVLVAGLLGFVLWFGSRSKKSTSESNKEPPAVDISRANTDDVGLKGLSNNISNPSALSPRKSIRNPQSGFYSQDTRPTSGRSADAGNPYGRLGSSGDHTELQGYNNQSIGRKTKRESFLNMGPANEGESPVTAEPTAHSPTQYPRPPSAQPIVRPYVIGSHPYASPLHASFSPVASPFSPAHHLPTQPEVEHDEEPPNLNRSASFAGAGTRPAYDAYDFEPKTATPIATLTARSSLESVRNIAKSARAEDQEYMKHSTILPSRSRKNSSSSSIIRFATGAPPSTANSAKGGKEKITKEEKAREMAAMDSLIAALDESAEIEQRRQERLASAVAGQSQVSSPRRRDVDITGSYPLPPPEVFRKALTARPSGEEVDDAEIARWRKR